MKLDELKNTHLFLILALIVTTLGIVQIVNQRQQTALITRALSMRTGQNEKDDPYDRGVKNQILKAYPAIKKHYQAYTAAHPEKKEGSIVIDWTIDTDGVPGRVQVVTSDFADKNFEGSIIREIEKIRFPEPPFNRYVTHTFRFKDVDTPQGEEK